MKKKYTKLKQTFNKKNVSLYAKDLALSDSEQIIHTDKGTIKFEEDKFKFESEKKESAHYEFEYEQISRIAKDNSNFSVEYGPLYFEFQVLEEQ